MSVPGELIDPTNSGADVWADSAYRSEQIEEELLNKGHRSRIQQGEKREAVELSWKGVATGRGQKYAVGQSIYHNIWSAK